MLDIDTRNTLMMLYTEGKERSIMHQSNYASRRTFECFRDEPLTQFLREIRQGGVQAAMQLLTKKPDILKGLTPNYRNAALGIVFEELQIAKLMAEVCRQKLPIELYAGDGRGVFCFQSNTMSTPVYTDAVFRNTKTNEFFAIQFKYSDDPMKLLETIQSWKSKHEHAAQDHLPEALRLENVQVVAPESVADGELAKATMNIGLEQQTDSIEVIEKFLSENEKVLKELLQDESFSSKLEQIKQKGREALVNKNTAVATKEKVDMKTADMTIPSDKKNALLAKYKADQEAFESRSKRLYQEREALENELRSLLTGKIQCKTREQLKMIAKQCGVEVAAGAIADGLLSFVISFDEEIRLYLQGKISGAECARWIMKQTAIGIVRGAVFGGASSLIPSLGESLTAAGRVLTGKFLRTLSFLLGPPAALAIVAWSVWSIMRSASPADEKRDEIVRLLTTTLFNFFAPLGLAATGLPALAACTGVYILVGTGNHLFGKKLCQLIFGNDKDLTKTVLNESYEVLGCPEDCSNDELKKATEARKADVQKFEEKNNEDGEKFLAAIDLAFYFITKHRSGSPEAN